MIEIKTIANFIKVGLDPSKIAVVYLTQVSTQVDVSTFVAEFPIIILASIGKFSFKIAHIEDL